MKARCGNEYKLDPKELAGGVDPRLMDRRNRLCGRLATTTRPPPRYPNSRHRDLCQWCAEQWDKEAGELRAKENLA
jgi:hypothetical protein